MTALSENADLSEKNAEGDLVLKRYLSIPRAAIFESKVCLGIPSFAAAPNGPAMPRDSLSAASIISFPVEETSGQGLGFSGER